MDINERCTEVMKARGWTQRRLAEEIGMSENNLSTARKGRRPMPAHALIRLERLRGTDDHSIIEQLLKTAACVALAVVVFFMTDAQNMTDPSMLYALGFVSNTNYGGFAVLLIALVLVAFQYRPSPGCSRRVLATA